MAHQGNEEVLDDQGIDLSRNQRHRGRTGSMEGQNQVQSHGPETGQGEAEVPCTVSQTTTPTRSNSDEDMVAYSRSEPAMSGQAGDWNSQQRSATGTGQARARIRIRNINRQPS